MFQREISLFVSSKWHHQSKDSVDSKLAQLIHPLQIDSFESELTKNWLSCFIKDSILLKLTQNRFSPLQIDSFDSEMTKNWLWTDTKRVKSESTQSLWVNWVNSESGWVSVIGIVCLMRYPNFIRKHSVAFILQNFEHFLSIVSLFAIFTITCSNNVFLWS